MWACVTRKASDLTAKEGICATPLRNIKSWDNARRPNALGHLNSDLVTNQTMTDVQAAGEQLHKQQYPTNSGCEVNSTFQGDTGNLIAWWQYQIVKKKACCGASQSFHICWMSPCHSPNMKTITASLLPFQTLPAYPWTSVLLWHGRLQPNFCIFENVSVVSSHHLKANWYKRSDEEKWNLPSATF